jgi:putative endonuclease
VLNQADKSVLAGISAYDRSASLYELVVAHVSACMAELPRTVRVKSLQASTLSHASVVRSVQVKLTDGAVIVIETGQVYTTRSVTVLSKHETPAEIWHVYVVRCADGTLYCGNTNNVSRRVHEHNTSARGAKYTRGRRPVKLVRSWAVGTRSDAAKAELRFKKLTREQKEDVIQATVPREPARPTDDRAARSDG